MSALFVSLFSLHAVSGAAQSSSAARPDTSAPSSEGHRLVWDDAWPRYQALGYDVTLAAITGALVATFLVPAPLTPRWDGGVLFDGAVRGALRARDPELRDAARLGSDVTLLLAVAQAGLIDGFLVPIADHNLDVAWKLSLINAEAFSLNILISTLIFKAAARARPSYRQCLADPGFDPLCRRGSFASFPSSHTSTSFTAAGLTCIHHANLPLYGGAAWDALACAGSLVLASATGLLRIVGDRHYLSDVLVGALLGFALGYVYPWLIHYRHDTRTPARGFDAARSELGQGGALPASIALSGAF